jgi:hypothetical protein
MQIRSRRAFLGTSLALATALVGCRRKEPEFSCNQLDGLSEGDLAARRRVDYLEHSPDPARTCEACRQWIAPSDGRCGGCKLFAGPVHPKGTCRLFAPS